MISDVEQAPTLNLLLPYLPISSPTALLIRSLQVVLGTIPTKKALWALPTIYLPTLPSLPFLGTQPPRTTNLPTPLVNNLLNRQWTLLLSLVNGTALLLQTFLTKILLLLTLLLGARPFCPTLNTLRVNRLDLPLPHPPVHPLSSL